MQKKLTITVSQEVYDGLYRELEPRKIPRFIEHVVRPYVLPQELVDAYAAMAADEAREAEALEWAEGLMGDVADDPR